MKKITVAVIVLILAATLFGCNKEIVEEKDSLLNIPNTDTITRIQYSNVIFDLLDGEPVNNMGVEISDADKEIVVASFMVTKGFLDLENGLEFAPDRNLTNKEFVQSLYAILDSKNALKEVSDVKEFTDIECCSEDPFIEIFEKVQKTGLLNSYPREEFKMNENVEATTVSEVLRNLKVNILKNEESASR